jgi:hypothetical protein
LEIWEVEGVYVRSIKNQQQKQKPEQAAMHGDPGL